MSKPTLAEKIRRLLATGEFEDGRGVARRVRITAEQRTALTAHAEALEAISPETSAKDVIGRWARARRCWCDLTGEPLI